MKKVTRFFGSVLEWKEGKEGQDMSIRNPQEETDIERKADFMKEYESPSTVIAEHKDLFVNLLTCVVNPSLPIHVIRST